MECSLTIDQFLKCLETIVEVSDSLLDGWELITTQDVENNKYLMKKVIKTLTIDDKQIVVTFEYHVAYHISYAVPVLCFNIWKQDGALFSSEQYWTHNKQFSGSDMYDTLTQMDHPVVRRPFQTLHPCRTQEIIQPFLESSQNPVISWLSVVGPYVGLNLSEAYFLKCIKL